MPVSQVLTLVRRKDLTLCHDLVTPVLGFTIAHGKIVAIDVLADPERLSRTADGR